MLARIAFLSLLAVGGFTWAADASAEQADIKNHLRSLAPSQSKATRLEELKRLRRLSQEDAHQLSPEILEAIEKASSDSDAEIRFAAVNALGLACWHQDEQCRLVLIERLFDQDAEVRWVASDYVGILEAPKSAVPRLIGATKHPDHHVRTGAILALGSQEPQDPNIVKALEQATQDSHFGVAHNAHIQLFEHTGKLQPLIRYAVFGVEEHARHSHRDDMADLSEAEQAQATWREVLVIACAKVLLREAKKNPREVAEIIIPMLKDPSPIVRRSAARNLGAVSLANRNAKTVLREMDAEALLKPLLDDPDESVRRNAAYGLMYLRQEVNHDPQKKTDGADEPAEVLPKSGSASADATTECQ